MTEAADRTGEQARGQEQDAPAPGADTEEASMTEHTGSPAEQQPGVDRTTEAAAAAEAADPDGLGDPDVAEGTDPVAEAQRALEERTRDLQRLQAEFLNYKRRVERDRELLKENARYDVLAPITEVLDTIDRAREHAELDGGLKAVADQLERTVAQLGLTKYGEPGDPFDPSLHEALSHLGEDPEVEVPTCKVIAKAGYRIGDRVVRAAQVLVADPAS